jgi:steroid delta-isomerase-like uncharacterized protein
MLRGILAGALLLGFAAAASGDEPEMDNKALLGKFYTEAVNQGNLDMIDEMLAEDFVEHEPIPGMEPGREGVKQWFTHLRTAFPDLKFDVKFMLSDEDMVAAYITMSGTQKGEFMGSPAKGKSFAADIIDIVRFKDGKAVEHWGVTDAMAMMEQLGMSPPPPHGEK